MPHVLIQFEQPFEPVVERLDGLAATGIELSARGPFQKLPALQSATVMLVAWLRSGRPAARFAATAIFRAEETPSCSPVLRVIFHLLRQLVAVVAAVGQNVVNILRQGG